MNDKVIPLKNMSLSEHYLLDPDYLLNTLTDSLDEKSFRNQYLIRELLSKLPRPGYPAAKRVENAIIKLRESEVNCASINHTGYRTSTPRDYFEQVMLYAQRIVADIIGDFSFGIFERSAFSSGATVSRTKKYGDAYYKYHSTLPVSVTPGCYNYAYALITATPLWCSIGAWDNITLSIGNDVTTVPKKTEVDRTIAKEPCLNMALQRSVGCHIRDRLKRYGINLRDQSRNQRLALRGSIHGDLATIDLAAASDSISRRLVRDLLPNQWYEVLDRLRSHYGTLPDGETIMWEKFSSMGNGFTFELETLIFYALSVAVTKVEGLNQSDVSVYGDDIIVPTGAAVNLIHVLYDVGFSTNSDKTFVSGPFRESCGKHYYNGIDVSPFYIRSPIDSVVRVIWFLNALRKWATLGDLVDPRVFDIWKKVKRKFIPSHFLGGRDPDSLGAVVSPELPRSKLALLPSVKRINGKRALLRYFQYNLIPDESIYQMSQPLQFSKDMVLDVTRPMFRWGKDPEWGSIADQVRVQYTITDNPDGDWWSSPSLFPQEIASTYG